MKKCAPGGKSAPARPGKGAAGAKGGRPTPPWMNKGKK